MSNDGALVILGAGGHGRVAASTARACGWKTISFLDPNFPTLLNAGGWPVEGDGRDIGLIGPRSVIVGIGNNRERLAQIAACQVQGLEIVRLIHPTAWICPDALIGDGAVVFAQAAINNGTAVGTGAIINTGAIVEHDCEIGDGAHISPGAVLAGNVRVGCGAWVGAGASIRQGVKIGEYAIIGLGAAVISDVAPGQTYVGVPAKPL